MLEILCRSARGGRFMVGPEWLAANMRLDLGTSAPVEMYVLSPSSQSITDAAGELASLIPTAGEPIRRFHSVTPNGLSVVLLLKANSGSLLLGADLEVGGDDSRGSRGSKIERSPLRGVLRLQGRTSWLAKCRP